MISVIDITLHVVLKEHVCREEMNAQRLSWQLPVWIERLTHYVSQNVYFTMYSFSLSNSSIFFPLLNIISFVLFNSALSNAWWIKRYINTYYYYSTLYCIILCIIWSERFRFIKLSKKCYNMHITICIVKCVVS